MSNLNLSLSVILGHVINTVQFDILTDYSQHLQDEEWDAYAPENNLDTVGLFQTMEMRELGVQLVNGIKNLSNLSAKEMDICKKSLAYFEKSPDTKRHDVVRHVRTELPEFNI